MKRCLLAVALVGCSARSGLEEPAPLATCPDPLASKVGGFAVAGPHIAAQIGHDFVRADLDGHIRQVLVPEIVGNTIPRVTQVEIDAGDVFFLHDRTLEKMPLEGGLRTPLASFPPCGWDNCPTLGPFGVRANTVVVGRAFPSAPRWFDRLDRTGADNGKMTLSTPEYGVKGYVVVADHAVFVSEESMVRWGPSVQTIGDRAQIAADSRFLYAARPRSTNAVDVERLPIAGGAWEHFATYEANADVRWILRSFDVTENGAVLQMESVAQSSTVAVVLLRPAAPPRTLAICQGTHDEYGADRVRVDGSSAFFTVDGDLRRVSL